jgi:hypothetical protein
MSFTFVVYGRNWVAAETRVLQAPAAKAAPAPPANEASVKTPIVRQLLETLKNPEAGDGTEEERKFVREQLLQADNELSASLGGNTRNAILKANNRLPAFRIPKGSTSNTRRLRPSP